MPFVEISGKEIRNLQEFHINPSRQNNLFFGKNGAGKTSLLEAIYLNSLGRSFKTSSLNNIINDTAESCFVFSRFYDEQSQTRHKIGLHRQKGNKQTIKLDDKLITSPAPLALLIPALAILPSETLLIDGGPSIRRKYLDWIMFHVEPGFLSLWKQHQNLLKQRNHLLKSGQRQVGKTRNILRELSSWDQQFVSINNRINELREPVFGPLMLKAQSILSGLPAFKADASSLKGAFYKGWATKQGGFEEALKQGLEQDLRAGFTKHGAHRADFLLSVKGNSAKEYLSSGQKKLLSISMRIAQAQELRERTGKTAVLLVDDLFAELDEENSQAFISILEELEIQTFFTSLSREVGPRFFKKELKMFHVEQGVVSEFSR